MCGSVGSTEKTRRHSDPSERLFLGQAQTTILALTAMGMVLSDDFSQNAIMLLWDCPGAVVAPMTRTSDTIPGIEKLLMPLLFYRPE